MNATKQLNELGQSLLGEFAAAGIEVTALAAQLQDEGARSFVKSWQDLMSVLEAKTNQLKPAIASPILES